MASSWRKTGAVFLVLSLLGLASADAKRPDQIPLAGIEEVEPMPEVATDFDGVAALPQEEGPETTIDPELYKSLKENARHDPFAQRPDVTIPLVFERATVNRSFAGLDHATSVGADGQFWPPDTTLGKGGSQVIEAANSAIRLMTAAGVAVATKSLNTFFSSDPSVEGMIFDPRVVYDRLGPNTRYFVVSLQRNNTLKTASIYLAVSRSSAPPDLEPTNWCRYKINSVRAATDKDGTTWADYPMVGVGVDAFLISNDQFSFPMSTPEDYRYKYGILRVVNKSLLTNNSITCPQYSSSLFFPEQVLAGTTGPQQKNGHVQPVFHYTAPSSWATGGNPRANPAYMVSTVLANPASSTYRLWRVSNVSSGNPLVEVLNMQAGLAYTLPYEAVQPNSTVKLATKDNRVMQVVGGGDTLYAVHPTNCSLTVGGVTFYKACIRFVQIFVSDSNGQLGAIFQQVVTLGSPDSEVDLSYFMPGIAVSGSGQTGIVFLASSSEVYLSAAWTTKYVGDTLFSPATVFNSGDCARATSKAGDYVWAQVNPNDLASFWFAGENASVSGGSCTWKTQITQVTP